MHIIFLNFSFKKKRLQSWNCQSNYEENAWVWSGILLQKRVQNPYRYVHFSKWRDKKIEEIRMGCEKSINLFEI